MKQLRRGDIYYADLGSVVGSEQGGVRPVLIVQNDVGNFHSPTIIKLLQMGKEIDYFCDSIRKGYVNYADLRKAQADEGYSVHIKG